MTFEEILKYIFDEYNLVIFFNSNINLYSFFLNSFPLNFLVNYILIYRLCQDNVCIIETPCIYQTIYTGVRF